MKKNLLILICALSAMTSVAQELNVMTFNIRLNIASDSLNAWPYRKDIAADEIRYHQVQLLGVQEALHVQMTDLQERLPSFKYIGGGRDDGKEKGEYSAIFYDTTVVKVLQSETFWLSEMPTVAGSKGWDAAYPRVVTWGKFQFRKSKKIFYAFNTHFDHMGKIARRESALFLLKKIKEIAGNTPAVVTGDFNASPQDEPIQVIRDKSNEGYLIDSKELSAKGHYGPTGTFNGFGPKERNDDPIDYIFLKGNWKVKNHATISQSWRGRFASDHFAVLSTLAL
ncbi:endonuclease/exonuclease/phosphatase family protein [Ferruginibacter sp. HRS2-29]|uniref:endonuclease/exonuclease/phosphatase family protein n=1 Tax=Ferruginibacter sp. HRS2-29 TaxID=2487334 RepID=UPI0020CDDAF4|nr:endonuclease/exonuclease/phosphatase family protein [Ferruginibacter sp. HRS2-29]MCP9752769.1 endonuclease/exonuclease/phosphatase family protein [Ferruginibacter sp. HRS2-29]